MNVGTGYHEGRVGRKGRLAICLVDSLRGLAKLRNPGGQMGNFGLLTTGDRAFSPPQKFSQEIN